jgi:hypothetical protein
MLTLGLTIGLTADANEAVLPPIACLVVEV